MKVVTVVGARPQFIKAAAVSRKLRINHTEILVHTGQHYDYNMSQQFFEELDIPKPDYNLGISGGSHAQMTGRMMMALEEILKKEMPDWLLVYGDTNSTLAAALAASKLYIKICHCEAGVRVHDMHNPEEINRICTDHLSALLLAGTQRSYEELKKEGLMERCGGGYVGDPMYDAFLQYRHKKRIEDIRLKLLTGTSRQVPGRYYFLTCHREENTRSDDALIQILKAMEQMGDYTIYPVHPRNRQRAEQIVSRYGFKRVILCEPVGYLESIALLSDSMGVVTDSGGVQREAFFAGRKCITVLDYAVWPETMHGNRNQLAKADAEEIAAKMSMPMELDSNRQPFGDGCAARRIVDALEGSRSEMDEDRIVKKNQG